MIISIADSMKKAIIRDLNFEFTPEDTIYKGELVKFIKPIKVLGNLKALQGVIDLNVNLSTTVEYQCSRCLDLYKEDITLHIEDRLAKEVSEDDYDTIQLSEGDSVDIADILTQDIISSLPIQHVCNVDCKGLCQQCGANLNRETCDCDRKQVDVRLEALRDLF